MGLKNIGVRSTMLSPVKYSATTKVVSASIASLPLLISPFLALRRCWMSSGKSPRGSNPRSPGATSEYTARPASPLAIRSAFSMRISPFRPRSPYRSSRTAVAPRIMAQNNGETCCSPPLISEGLRPPSVTSGATRKRFARAGSKSSCRGHAAAASMAKRPCLISARRILRSSCLFSLTLKGSMPRSPGIGSATCSSSSSCAFVSVTARSPAGSRGSTRLSMSPRKVVARSLSAVAVLSRA
mmetsp:Transcript_15628/g.31685  ORF Transcript_15628/g.31685 Transcript_15628/m.31685 type:complete len:241 (-) Transcript_15628:2028-2750(-)